jgi:hypothetical protein
MLTNSPQRTHMLLVTCNDVRDSGEYHRKSRTCLRCNTAFDSAGAGDCLRCKGSTAWRNGGIVIQISQPRSAIRSS